MTTHSLAEAAVVLCGAADDAAIQWLLRRLRRGELLGYKVQRRWRMTDAQLAENLVRLSPKVPVVPTGGLTRTSRRRLRAS